MTEHKMTLKQMSQHLPGDYIIRPNIKEGDTILIVPDRKVVDLSKVVGTRIPMVFGDRPFQGYLASIEDGYHYHSGGQNSKRCEFDTSPEAWVSWGPHVPWYTGECPLPEGVEYAAITQDRLSIGHWEHGSHGTRNKDIIAFRVTGLKDGWVYPWEGK